MKIKIKLVSLSLISILALSLNACSSSKMQSAQQTKPGFSNLTDIPLPQTANMDLNKSMVMGGGDKWTGHLVYNIDKPKVQVIDYINQEMLQTGWSKVNELRGNESIITFMKAKRIAAVKIATDSGYFTNQTIVTIDMSNSNLRHVDVTTQPETENS